ncbi:hypothetical protein RL72_01578 [Microbacterium azadirachtae]|uniref:Uncharacterized protein n=1 Tax=Microbacterium azadirachtae TaxID=582680 RepID=A0A0F0KXP3_9MICO|nr:hypothetical protein [Microbacterium azadirachtae]KJL24855.1 hypothetical protein RL72_01578 [Microbacterium azadirachtae]
MVTTINLQELDGQQRAEIAAEVVDRVLDQTLATLENIQRLKRVVLAFSVRHGQAVDTAVNGLLDALEVLVPDLEAVNSHPETWDRHQ